MGRTFTQYWTKSFWQETGREEGQALSHTASDQFEALGVDEGDTIYIITVQDGALYLVGRLSVFFLADREYAADVLAYRPWHRKDHLFASECTAVRFDRRVPAHLVQALRVEGPSGEAAVALDADGNPTEEALDGVRCISSSSADLLDRMLEGERTFTADWPDDEEDDEEEALDSQEFDAIEDRGDEEEADDEDEAESVIEPLVAYFEEEEYDYSLVDGGLRCSFDDDGAEYPVLAEAVGGRVVVTANLPTRVPEDRRGAVAEAVCRANAESVEATFLINFETGIVCCRSVTFNDAGFLDSEAMGNVFEDTLERAMVYNGFFGQVVSATRTPSDAVAAAEIELEMAAPDDDDGDETRAGGGDAAPASCGLGQGGCS